MPDHYPHALEDHDLGLAHDLQRLNLNSQVAGRRRSLSWLMGATTMSLFGCGGGGSAVADSTASTSSTTTTTSTGSGTGTTTTAPTTTPTCSLIPEETAGPYPGDGSNSAGGSIANVLGSSGIVRSDIRSSIDGATGVATGVPLTVQLHLVNTSGSCADLSGYAIYLWHCDAQGRYSMYSSGVTAENYLRGVQLTDIAGIASFTTVFPGCYAGRMPHIHFEVYRNLSAATGGFANKLKTSQLAFPTAPCNQVYNGAAAYSASIRNFAAISFATDMVFSDGVSQQLATVSGKLGDGYLATLNVGIAA